MFSLTGSALATVIGITPLIWLPEIPAIKTILCLLIIALLLALRGVRALRYAALTLCMLCWGLLAARQMLLPMETMSHQSLDVESVEIASVKKEGEPYHLLIQKIHSQWLFPPLRVQVVHSPPGMQTCPGQRWRMTLRLSPIHGQLNNGGFDAQRFMLAQGITLRARILRAEPMDLSCSLRWHLIKHIRRQSEGLVWQEVLLALGFGERAGMDDVYRKLLRDTGTAHLMAISGLHIGLSAIMGWAFAGLLQRLMPARYIGWRFPLIFSLMMAAIYTWLAGAQPPAFRTLTALIVSGILKLSGQRWSGWQILLSCVAIMLFLDPLSVLSDSFLLSVFAVGGLLFWYQWFPVTLKTRQWAIRQIVGLGHLQAGMMVLLLPLQVWIFHGVSLTSLPANMLAVPVITFITVPLILFAMLLTSVSPVAHTLLKMADGTLEGVFTFLRWLPAGWLEVDARFVGVSLVPWAMLIAWQFQGWRYWGGCMISLLVALSVPFWRMDNSVSWRLHLLDIGHGLAIVVERHGRALLYDSGNAWPGGDAGRQTIIPWLRWHRLVPERIIISHEHLDHIGGLKSLISEWPGLKIDSSLGEKGHAPCRQGMNYQWQGLEVRALWPPPDWQGVGNNRSCVVIISDGLHRVLLTGDIEAKAERAMIGQIGRALHAQTLVVPHHGSRTSSTPALIHQVSPSLALISVARYNPWRLPATGIVRRYFDSNIQWLDTARHGQISIEFHGDRRRVLGFRSQISPRWYHQWFGVIPVNR